MKTMRVPIAATMAAALALGTVPAAYAVDDGAVDISDVLEGSVSLSGALPQEATAADAPVTLSAMAASAASTEAVDISKAKVSGIKSAYTYTGSAIKPKPVVKVAGKVVPSDSYKVTYSHNKRVGRAAVVITGVGTAKGAVTRGFDIIPRSTSLKKVTAVGAGAEVTWKRRSVQVDGYQIAYSTSKSMKAASKKKAKGAKKKSLVIRGLKMGKTYYIKVRTYKGSQYSTWSKAKKLKLKKPGRKDLTKLLDKASSKNKGTKKLKVYNSTYQVSKTKAGKKLLKYLKKLRKSYRVNIAMIDITTGEALTYSPLRSMYSASCLKGPYVASLNKWEPSSKSGHKGTMRETIVWSNNDTYASLRSEFGSWTMRKMHLYSGVDTDQYEFKYHWLPTRDLAKLWVGTYWYFYKDTNKNSKWARSLYTHGYESFMYRGLKGTWKVHAKPGWYPGEGKDVQNDAGVVMAKVDGKSRPYVVAYMTSLCDEHPKLRKLVRLVDAVHTDMVKNS